MLKIYIFVFISLMTNLTFLNALADKEDKETNLISEKNRHWEIDNSNFDNKLFWYKEDQKTFNEKEIKRFNKKNNYVIRSTVKGVSVNGFFYPDISNYVPNAFVEDPNKLFGFHYRGISKTRHCNGKNFSESCIDGILDFDFRLFNNDNLSIYPKINLQSLTSRGTEFGEGVSLGIKVAKEINSFWSFAFGGENIFHFDETVDLGRNFYLVTSTFLPLNDQKSTMIFLNAGIGSDFYGYNSNGYLFRTSCLGGNTLTGTRDKPNTCSWGPIGSIALVVNDRFSIINEWFGYSYGSGFSLRPFKDSSLSLSIFATDYIKGLPEFAEEYCPNNLCETRFYGSISMSF